MTPTIDYIKKRFEYYNSLCFDGKLSMPHIGLNNRYCSAGIMHCVSVADEDGKRHNERFEIELSIRLNLQEEDIDSIIVHEMIHYYIAYNNLKDDSPHGHLFRSIMDEINEKYGMKIETFFNPSDEILLKSFSKTRLISVSQLKDGRTGLAVVLKKKAFQIWDAFVASDDVEQTKWYLSNCAIFDKYPLTANPTLYFVNADVVEHYLTGAVEMIREGDVIHQA